MTVRVGLWFALLLAAGCAKTPPAPVAATPPADPPVAAVPTPTPPASFAGLDAKLHQSFETACANEIDADAGQQVPPDNTIGGKSCAKVYDALFAAWKTIKFTGPDGKPQTWTATITTDQGVIEMVLLHDLAPNHCRNFIALAQCGYYDGLGFERLVRQQADDGSKLELIEAGCPNGTGEPGYGHLGYFVKPEFSESVKHEPGLVGACHDANPNSAGVRFYVALSAAPALDGHFSIFGKITQGLEIAQGIAAAPRAAGSEDRPATMVKIKSVLVRSQ